MLSTEDKFAVVEACARMTAYADRREWDRLAEVFADEVSLDYTSLNGGEPSLLAAQDIADAWAAGLGGLDCTQHLASGHLVEGEGDAAVCTATFQAVHKLDNPHGSPLWTLGGDYRFELARIEGAWRITAVTMTAKWAAGNQTVMELAAQL